MNLPGPSAQTILAQAIELGLNSGWNNFTLLELAKACQCTLIDIKSCFRSKDDLAEAFFDLADSAMLQRASEADFLTKTTEQRTLDCMMTWFYFLAPYKAIVKDIMRYKLEPGHFHLQAHGITRVSRTVQWFRAVSERPHQGLGQVADEIALTSAYLSCLLLFLMDNSEQHYKTRALLRRLLTSIDNTHRCFSERSLLKNGMRSLLKKFKSN